jgi:site-specific DNA-methyltransferase (adenine-specific)
MKTLPSNSVDLIFADPEYNVGKDYGVSKDDREDYYNWCFLWITEAFRVLKPTGSFYLKTIQDHLKNMLIFMDNYGIMQNIIIWKNTSMPSKKRYTRSYEPILFYTKTEKFKYHHDADGEPTKAAMPYGKKVASFTMKDIWDDIKFVSGGCMASKEAILIPGTKKKYHPCQMPLRLANRIIRASSDEGDICYDMFSGSGTFTVKAKELNRKYIATEINQDYIDNIINKRLERIENLNCSGQQLSMIG